MSIHVEHWNEAKDGKMTPASIKGKLEKLGYHVIEHQFAPGYSLPDHTHDETKKDAIASGQFRLSMYGQEVILKPGDMVDIPQNVVHNAGVVGNEPVIFFDATK